VSSIVYVVADKLGGIASLNSNLIRHAPSGRVRQIAVVLRDRYDAAVIMQERLGADDEFRFEYSSRENVYSVLRRLHQLIPPGPGALVSNNGTELAVYSVHRAMRTIFQIVHDEYNFRLAKTYEPIVDVMIAHSRFYYEKLCREFPERSGSIFYLPYGIRLASRTRISDKGALKLVFLGRLCEAKGIFDLPQIDRLLQQASVDVCWTVIGDGPDKIHLQKKWPSNSRVHYASPATNEQVLELCTEGDVFVLPSRFEGFPVALLEAMSAGLVPVVSNLPSGIPEVVVEGVGFRPPVGDCEKFASAIIRLANDSGELEAMSKAARKQAERFDVRERAAAYHALFSRWKEFERPWSGPLAFKHGSRLDQRWLPNPATRFLRLLVQLSIFRKERP